MPNLLYFIPAISYMFFYRKIYIFPILSFGLYLLHPSIELTLQIIFMIYCSLISLYLATQAKTRLNLISRCKTLRDTATENSITLKKQNQELIKINYENLHFTTLNERNRIAREIHDNVGHMLSRSILQLGALQIICKDDALKPHLETLKNTLDDAMNNIRNSVHDLHDDVIHLDTAIHDLIQKFDFCPITFTYHITSDIPKDVKYCFITVIKESLTNIMKHSNATQATITIKEHFAFYQLIVQDNGSNINSNTLDENVSGIGLTSMKERVNMIQGNIHISSESGFRIFITIPKN